MNADVVRVDGNIRTIRKVDVTLLYRRSDSPLFDASADFELESSPLSAITGTTVKLGESIGACQS